MTSITPALQWRYACKQFDTAKKVSEEDVNDLLESLRLSASSYGIQPWKFLVITDPAIRAKLKEKAWNQAQISDASHLIVLCAKKKLDETDIEKYIKDIAQTRGIALDALAGMNDMMLGSIGRQTPEQLQIWNQKQVYIALGTLLAAAAVKNIDACPMEGFDPAGFDEVLGLSAENLIATVLCPIGYRMASDTVAAKVRFPLSEIIERR